jgi:D-3-phosphoglycerate dehydrogenase
MPTVLVTDHPAPDTEIERDLLDRIDGQLLIAEDGSEAELLRLVPDADAILTCFRLVTPAVVRAGARLKVIGRYGVGVDNIAVDVATELGIPVTNVPVYCTDEVAEHSMALMFALLRKVATYDRAVRSGDWRIDTGIPIRRVSGSVLGIVGFGRIGHAVLSRAVGMEMRVIVADRSADPDDVRQAGATMVELDELLSTSDVVSLHLPLTPQTRGLIDADRLALMRTNAVLINCARGPIVDLDALAAALREGRIAGAALDVFEPERLAADHPLLGLDNVLLTPHVAFYSEESIAELRRLATENVVAVLTGRVPHSVVNEPVTARE